MVRFLTLLAVLLTLAACSQPLASSPTFASPAPEPLEGPPTAERVERTFAMLRDAVASGEEGDLAAVEDGLGRFALGYLATKHLARRSDRVSEGLRVTEAVFFMMMLQVLLGDSDPEPYLALPIDEGTERALVASGIAEPAELEPGPFPGSPPDLADGKRDLKVTQGAALLKWKDFERRLAEQRAKRLAELQALPLARCAAPEILGTRSLNDPAVVPAFAISHTATDWAEKTEVMIVVKLRCPRQTGLFVLTKYSDQKVRVDNEHLPLHFAPILGWSLLTPEAWARLEPRLMTEVTPLRGEL